MFGDTYGEGVGAGDLPWWRAFVEASIDGPNKGDVAGVGGSMSQGVSAVTGAADPGAKAAAIGASTGSLSGALNLFTAGGAVVVEASASLTADGVVAANGVGVIAASGALTGDGTITVKSAAVGASKPTMDGQGDLAPTAQSFSGGVGHVSAEWVVEANTQSREAPEVYEPNPPGMEPLIRSHEADILETELKALFVLVFEKYIRDGERYVNVLGMPQHGTRELIDASLVNNGLSIYRGADPGGNAASYLLRAWMAMNPKRGLKLLETYLQLIWPNVWTVKQMWQDKTDTFDYPAGVVPEDGGNHFLTSRVNVSLPSQVTSGGDLASIASGLRASVPARIVLNIAIETVDDFSIGLASAYYKGVVGQAYEGKIA